MEERKLTQQIEQILSERGSCEGSCDCWSDAANQRSAQDLSVRIALDIAKFATILVRLRKVPMSHVFHRWIGAQMLAFAVQSFARGLCAPEQMRRTLEVLLANVNTRPSNDVYLPLSKGGVA